ncbi:hypothetical protein EX895_004968 [Sporisorium graminicola]|uniref:Uncharacterized protein n=1 Tax=Sporisorium graminicola TaxID=280036 RepID=A0A4U7KPI9_9BASI|nr:hypothetical protein EX895_004968 [Sporisorium graminicola]TKY86143.1 hypothetical protein EX895_004968 [Sporisorium graminicola]
MAITLQTVLPQKVLPRAPSPNASSPNPGIRSTITQFIPASPDASLDNDPLTALTQEPALIGSALADGGSSTRLDSMRASSNGSQDRNDTSSAVPRLKSPKLGSSDGRKSMSAGAGSRRGIAHSSRILGVDKNAKEAIALSQLTNGKVDVSFEGTVDVSFEGTVDDGRSKGKGKGKGKAHDGDINESGTSQTPLFDIDLESGQPTASSSSNTSRAGRLLQMRSHSMPWIKSKSKSGSVPAYQGSADHTPNAAAPAPDSRDDSLDFHRPPKTYNHPRADYSGDVDGEDDDYHAESGVFDADREQLLHGGGDDAGRPGYFAPDDRSFGYNSLGGGAGLSGFGGAVGFEALTWREGGWMVLSAIAVAILMAVAILISIDVIDWPGDGIGKY